jgi:predicted RNase H-like HicB family nuclease
MTAQKVIRVFYEEVDGDWTATSPDYPGWRSFGDTREEALDLANQGLPEFAEDDFPGQTLVIVHMKDGVPAGLTLGAKSALSKTRHPIESIPSFNFKQNSEAQAETV